MKLYTSANSPFGARVAIAACAKNIDIDCLRPPTAGLRSPEFLALNPIAKIPVLVTEQGTVIPESEAIIDYLEDRFPTPSLRPADPEQRARVNIAVRVMDSYVMAPIIRLFPHLNPASRDERVVEQEFKRWTDGLTVLAHFLQSPLPEADAGVSLADCVLPPSLHLSTRIAAMLGMEDDPMNPHEVLVTYYARMKSHPVVGPVLADLTTAQAEYDIKAGRPSLAHRH